MTVRISPVLKVRAELTKVKRPVVAMFTDPTLPPFFWI
jgi:hypothetical protein